MSSPFVEARYDLVPADYAVKLDRCAVLFYLKQGHRNHAYLLSGAFALLLTLFLPRAARTLLFVAPMIIVVVPDRAFHDPAARASAASRS